MIEVALLVGLAVCSIVVAAVSAVLAVWFAAGWRIGRRHVEEARRLGSWPVRPRRRR